MAMMASVTGMANQMESRPATAGSKQEGNAAAPDDARRDGEDLLRGLHKDIGELIRHKDTDGQTRLRYLVRT